LDCLAFRHAFKEERRRFGIVLRDAPQSIAFLINWESQVSFFSTRGFHVLSS
jgi:hypothetical protein